MRPWHLSHLRQCPQRSALRGAQDPAFSALCPSCGRSPSSAAKGQVRLRCVPGSAEGEAGCGLVQAEQERAVDRAWEFRIFSESQGFRGPQVSGSM